MSKLTLQEILNSLPKISETRNYWFFRTNGGKYYEDFKEKKYIAIGYNRVTLATISSGNTRDATGIEILGEQIERIYKEEEGRPYFVASQLLKFAYEIKKGDIVFIPSESSTYITFGEVTATPVIIAENKDTVNCPYTKRKKVRWLKTITRDELDPNLYKLMFSHHTITNASGYAEQIDKLLNNFFIKGDTASLVLKVGTNEEVKGRDLSRLVDLPLDLLDEFCKQEGLDYNSEDYNIKLKLESPGLILLSGVSTGGIILIGIIIVAIAGGGFSLKNKSGLDLSLQSDGIIEKVRRFLISNKNAKLKAEVLKKVIDKVDVKEPEDLTNILKELDK